MRRIILLLFIYVLATVNISQANDSEFFMDGNHLVPVYQTSISIKKEILSIKCIDQSMAQVNVYYEFYNPDNEKEILVGFESEPSLNSESFEAVGNNGRNPNMDNFTVQANGTYLKYDITYVLQQDYQKIGIIKKGRTLEQMKKADATNFTYVYYFKVKFKKGLNIIKHTYDFTMGNSVAFNPMIYDLPYVLTSAMRWGNKQIDDFTLVLDMGDNVDFLVEKNFFQQSNEWKIAGIGKVSDTKKSELPFLENNATRFFMKRGVLCYQKTNFKPKGEIHIYQCRYFQTETIDRITDEKNYLNEFKDMSATMDDAPIDSFQRAVLENLPYARRGYIFSEPALKEYFESKRWYIADPNFIKDIENLYQEEKDWIEKWKIK